MCVSEREREREQKSEEGFENYTKLTSKCFLKFLKAQEYIHFEGQEKRLQVL